jgi:outer membrane lipoprotein carrier protein
MSPNSGVRPIGNFGMRPARLGIPGFFCYNFKDMRKISVILGIAGALAGGLSAQTRPQDAVAKLERTLATLTSFQADFEQTFYSTSISKPLREKGRLSYQKPDLMRWEYAAPEPKTYVYREGLLLSYFPEDNQLLKQRIPPEKYEMEIGGILAGKARLTENYAVEDSPFPGAGPNAVQLKLTPKTEGENAYILVEIDSQSWMLRRVVRFDWAGNRSEYVFSRLKSNPRFARDVFEVKVPPDCQIIEDVGFRKK